MVPVDVDVDRAWEVTVASLRRRIRLRAGRRGAIAALAVASAVLVAVSVVLLVDRSQPDGVVAFDDGSPRDARTLTEVRTDWGRFPVDARIRVIGGLPEGIRAGDVLTVTVTLENESDEVVELGSSGRPLATYVSDRDGRVVGGSEGRGRYPVGYDYPALDPGERLDVEVKVAASAFPADALRPAAAPLPEGDHLLWVELPVVAGGDGNAVRVAGPVPLAVTG